MTKRAEELYKTYEEAENKSYDDMVTFLDANYKSGDIYQKYSNQLQDANDFIYDAEFESMDALQKYEDELKSKMEVIKSKINGDYDYNEDLRGSRSIKWKNYSIVLICNS